MASHMKTTINVSDELMRRSRDVASREGITLRALFEEALRRALDDRERGVEFRLRDARVAGDGLQAGRTWDLPRELAYDERG